jgi:hypothetical protein
VTFPLGVLSFRIDGVPTGAEVTLTITTSSAISSYWKLVGGVWTQLPSTPTTGGLAVTFVDGGLGDADGVANGVIVDPGAPGQTAAIPTTTVTPTTVTPTISGPSPQIPSTGSDTLGWLSTALWLLGVGTAALLVVRRSRTPRRP